MKCAFWIAFVASLSLLILARQGRAAVADPSGDVMTSATAGSTKYDVLAVDAAIVQDGLKIDIAFNPALQVNLPSTGIAGALSGAIDIDLDSDSNTGMKPGFVDAVLEGESLAGFGLGVDAGIDFSFESTNPGYVAFSKGLNPIELLPVTLESNVLSITIPLSLLDSTESVSMSFLVGDDVGPTDAAGVLVTSIPEPTSAAILVSAFLGSALRRIRR